jgi:copper homeostasis protein
MHRDIDFAIEAGADGIVFGMLTADGQIDMPRSTQIVRRIEAASRRLQIVFHRAFDFTPDPLAALDRLIDLGVHRVLTSGQKPIALEGAMLIRTLIERSAGRIEILPAAGIRPENVARLIEQTGCVQVHASLRQTIADPVFHLSPSISLARSSGFADHASFTATSRNDVEALIARLNDAPIAQ